MFIFFYERRGCIANINGKWAVGIAKKAAAINIIVATINQWDCVNCTSHEYRSGK